VTPLPARMQGVQPGFSLLKHPRLQGSRRGGPTAAIGATLPLAAVAPKNRNPPTAALEGRHERCRSRSAEKARPTMRAAGLGINSPAGRPLTSAEEGAVGSPRRRPWSARTLIAALAARSLEQGAPHRSEAPVEAERCMDHTGPAPVRGENATSHCSTSPSTANSGDVISSGCRSMMCVSAAGCAIGRR
jgi:hypothetical protein